MTHQFSKKKSQLGHVDKNISGQKWTPVDSSSMWKKTFNSENNYWDSKPNPGFTVFQSCQSIFNISVFVMSWHGKMIQGSKKLPLHWCSNGFNSLVSDHLDCFHNDLHYERYTMTSCSKSEFSLRCDGKKLMAQKSHKERNYRHSFFCET